MPHSDDILSGSLLFYWFSQHFPLWQFEIVRVSSNVVVCYIFYFAVFL